MKDLDVHFDWHRKGLFCVKDPSGQLLFDTTSESASSACSAFVTSHNMPWSQAEALGYAMLEFQASAVLVNPPRDGESAEVVDPRYVLLSSNRGDVLNIHCSESGELLLISLNKGNDEHLRHRLDEALRPWKPHSPFELSASLTDGKVVIHDIPEWEGEHLVHEAYGYRLAMRGVLLEKMKGALPLDITFGELAVTAAKKRELLEREASLRTSKGLAPHYRHCDSKDID